MTQTAPRRLPDANLEDIVQRYGQPLNNDGLRVWYRQDVGSLLEEVMALRRERQHAISIFAAHPPLEGLDQSQSLVEIAEQLAVLWTRQLEGVWQKAEVKSIRENLASTKLNLTATTEDRDNKAKKIAEQEARISELETKVANTILEGVQAVEKLRQEFAAKKQQVKVAARQLEGMLD